MIRLGAQATNRRSRRSRSQRTRSTCRPWKYRPTATPTDGKCAGTGSGRKSCACAQRQRCPTSRKRGGEDYSREGIVRAPPSVRSAPSAALSKVIPERALELVMPESAPPRAVLTGVTIVQVRLKLCNQDRMLPGMHQGRQEGEVVRPNRGLNDNDCNGDDLSDVDATIDVESCFCILWPLPRCPWPPGVIVDSTWFVQGYNFSPIQERNDRSG